MEHPRRQIPHLNQYLVTDSGRDFYQCFYRSFCETGCKFGFGFWPAPVPYLPGDDPSLITITEFARKSKSSFLMGMEESTDIGYEGLGNFLT